ncbi:DedA family protein [Candidatus Fukatsuia symbiotica]|uniref:DedA family protein n=1 Tax=Candidatus Fukatsuia symbiotica TaxID=1878942 RepID=A0A2U8I5R7_9GAMM|nr:DedA family protein [Candidatus Fukatsuia symbiotica]AWK14482.1 DedA family protein [Candidatus Fukatsuia symbiotica]MEA9444771.1 DedA family protein [Candidatus Fukatsuia symbiotica]
MILNDIVTYITDFARAHEVWAIPLVFFLAFGESLAFLSLLLPATIILLGFGALIGESGISFWPIWVAAATGAFFGDWLSYWIGFHYKDRVNTLWPLSRNPHLLERGHAFFERWGIFGAFIGRFFGPLRAVVPLVAGVCAMPQGHFQFANVTSALIWAFGILAPGAFGIQWLAHWMG